MLHIRLLCANKNSYILTYLFKSELLSWLLCVRRDPVRCGTIYVVVAMVTCRQDMLLVQFYQALNGVSLRLMLFVCQTLSLLIKRMTNANVHYTKYNGFVPSGYLSRRCCLQLLFSLFVLNLLSDSAKFKSLCVCIQCVTSGSTTEVRSSFDRVIRRLTTENHTLITTALLSTCL